MIKPYRDKEGRTSYRFDIYVGGERQREKGFASIDDCKAAVEAIRTDHKRGVYGFKKERANIKVSDLKKSLLAKLGALQRARTTLAIYRRVLTGFADLYPDLLLEAIELRHLNGYYTHRLNLPTVSANTAVGDLSALMAALREARKIYPALKNWVIPEPERLKKQNQFRERVITEEEEEKIIEALHSPDWQANNDAQRENRKLVAVLFWLALRTGMRIGEILGLRKSAVNFQKAPGAPFGWISVRASGTNPRTKSGKNRIVYMHEDVAAVLKKRAALSRDYLFESHRKPGYPLQRMHRTFGKACERAGAVNVNFHDTRHTFATRALLAGVDVKTLGKILGHSDVYMTMRYLHSSNASELAAMQLVGASGSRDRIVTTFQGNHSKNKVHQSKKKSARSARK